MKKYIWLSEKDTDRELILSGGYSYYLYSLPRVLCDVCGDVWGRGMSLPIECPPEIRIDLDQISQSESVTVTPKEFSVLLDRWQPIIEKHGVRSKIEPGMKFQPLYWQMPVKLENDLYWTTYAPFVSSRMVDYFQSREITGSRFFSVVLERIGDLDPQGNELFEHYNLNEPLDIINEVPVLKSSDHSYKFYSMWFDFPGMRWKRENQPYQIVCKECGREKPADINYEYNRRASALLKTARQPRVAS